MRCSHPTETELQLSDQLLNSFKNPALKLLGKVAVQFEQEKEMGLGGIHGVGT